MLVAAAVLAFVVLIGAGTPEAAVSTTAGSCPVTIPEWTVRPRSGFTAAAFNYGNARLRAHLYWPRGTITAGTLSNGGAMAIVNTDGSISAKLGWWRGVAGRLAITGRRLDRRGPPLRADVPGGYGSRGFQPSGLTFPTVGCWRVTGKLPGARLSFVVKVTKLSRR
jgi:hypothetical protein